MPLKPSRHWVAFSFAPKIGGNVRLPPSSVRSATLRLGCSVARIWEHGNWPSCGVFGAAFISEFSNMLFCCFSLLYTNLANRPVDVADGWLIAYIYVMTGDSFDGVVGYAEDPSLSQVADGAVAFFLYSSYYCAIHRGEENYCGRRSLNWITLKWPLCG